MRHHVQRGSALLMSVIVVLVIAVIGASLLRVGSREVAGTSALRRRQALAACAEMGRQLILSRFHPLSGVSPDQLPVIDEPIDTSTGLRILGGHYDNAGDPTQPIQVTMLADRAFGPDRTTMGGTNRIALNRITPLKVVIHCQVGGDGTPTSGDQLEVEFGLRFGI
jgi:type II secretory pathway pseudopilin PulG